MSLIKKQKTAREAKPLPLNPQQQQLIESIKKNDIKAFHEMGGTNESFNLNFIFKDDGIFPLMFATQLGNYDFIKLMLQNPSIDINQKDKYGINCFWVACKHGFSSIMLILAKRGIDILNVSDQGINALHLAINKNFPDIIKLLISYSFPLNQQTNQGLTAVSIAVFRSLHECLELLIEAKADLDLHNAQGMSPLQLALKMRDNFASQMLIENGASIYFQDKARQHLSPIFYIARIENITLLECIHKKYPEIIHGIRTTDNQSLLQFASKYDLDEVVSYLTVICNHDEIDQEDPSGFNPFLYYLIKENFQMCSKLIFRGADVNHIYDSQGGKTALIMMVQDNKDNAIKFLLDKFANPHICFGLENLDACDLAKANGLDKRIFGFSQCTGEHKLIPKGLQKQQLQDLRNEIVNEFDGMIEGGKKLDEIDNLQWLDEELLQSNDQQLVALKKHSAYKTSQYDMIDKISQAKNTIKTEMEQYREKFQDPYEVELAELSFPQNLTREIMMKIEADRVKRKFEYEELNRMRGDQVNLNREKLQKQKFVLLQEIQEQNQKLESEYSSFLEVDYREQYLLDEKINNYKLKVEQNRQEQIVLVQKIKQKDSEREKKRKEEKLKKKLEEQEVEEIAVRAEIKRQEILNLQDILQKNAQEQRDKEKEIEKQRKDVWNHYTNIRKKIDYEQVRMEAMHFRKQVENDFLERDIQDKIKTARLALELKIGKIDQESKQVDGKINVAQMSRGKFNQFNPHYEEDADNWSEEDVLWESYKQRMREVEEVKLKLMATGDSLDFTSDNSLKLNQTLSKDFSQRQKLEGSSTRKHKEAKTEIGNKNRSSNMTIEDEMELANQMINQLSLKINNFAPGYKNKTPAKSNTYSNQKLMQKAFNKNMSNRSLIARPVTIQQQQKKKNNLQTAPSSPRSIVSTAKQDLNQFIKNRIQVETEKKFERNKRAQSNLRTNNNNSNINESSRLYN